MRFLMRDRKYPKCSDVLLLCTLRVGMNYVEASVSFNDKNLYTPVHNNAPVYLASASEITFIPQHLPWEDMCFALRTIRWNTV
mgnify:CR=1 FL=1